MFIEEETLPSFEDQEAGNDVQAEQAKDCCDPALEELEAQKMIEQKNRLNELISENQGDIAKAMFQFCYEFNIFYDSRVITNFLKQGDVTTIERLPSNYISIIKSDEKYSGLTFFSQLKLENFETIYSEDLAALSLGEEDRKNRQQVINILGYDPFQEDIEGDRPQLYRDLTGLLTENMRKDVAKQKAAVEIVRNYANIARYQKRVKDLMETGQLDSETQDQLDGYLGVISKIQSSVNQTTKENGFTGGKGIGSNGRGMLSDVMNQVEVQGFDEGITNFYDIATSKSIEEISNISWKAILNQLNLSQTDYVDILTQQANLVKTSIRTARDAVEALRLAKEKISKQELLDELEQTYRKKGISEEEIKEFVSREYELEDTKK